MDFNHLSGTTLQDKTIIIQLPMIVMFLKKILNQAKSGDSEGHKSGPVFCSHSLIGPTLAGKYFLLSSSSIQE